MTVDLYATATGLIERSPRPGCGAFMIMFAAPTR